MSIVINILLAIHVVVALLIVLIVLMQRPKNEGLGAAFGGGLTDQFLGAQTTNVLQKATRWLGGMFFLLALGLSMLYSKQTHASTQSLLQQQLSSAPAPKAAPAGGDKTNPNVINIDGNSHMTPDQVVKLLKEKMAAAAASASPAPASSPAAKPAGAPDNSNPPLQLQPGAGTGTSSDGLDNSKFQLQTGTATLPAQKKDGL